MIFKKKFSYTLMVVHARRPSQEHQIQAHAEAVAAMEIS